MDIAEWELVNEAQKSKDELMSLGLCDSCLGRLFSKLGYGLSNRRRGEILRTQFGWPETVDCSVCHGLMYEVQRFSELAMSKMNDYEFSNFLIGSRVDPSVIEAEERLWVKLKLQNSEPIKTEINREVGKLLEKNTGKPAEFDNPEIVAVIDTAYDNIELQIAPLFIYGRYKKLVRGIPQTRWPCRWCLGKGCEKCDFKGKMYETSVQEIIADEVMPLADGVEHFFHGMGREDVDARMLGNGRPFILEIRNPRLRTIDLRSVTIRVNAGNKVHISDLRTSSWEEVVELKGAKPSKTYRILVRFSPPVEKEKIKEVVSTFKGREIAQRTPERVAHRRADKLRKRRLIDIEVERLMEDMAEIHITAEAGTYIKELVHGDGGRTSPSLASALETNCDVVELDVICINED